MLGLGLGLGLGVNFKIEYRVITPIEVYIGLRLVLGCGDRA